MSSSSPSSEAAAGGAADIASPAAPLPLLPSVPAVEIDPEGVFKYVLLRVSQPSTSAVRFLVRGFGWASYHDDIYQPSKSAVLEAAAAVKADAVVVSCAGGGRIRHDAASQTILVYGYSQAYGRADHQIAVEALKAAYPGYSSITFSNDGY